MNNEPKPIRRGMVASPASHVPGSFDAQQVPKKWCWHFQSLHTLRQHLVEELRESLATTLEPVMNRTLIISLLSGEEDALAAVDAALDRIASGTYGICERTGLLIERIRLRALPWTRYCRQGQEAVEKARLFTTGIAAASGQNRRARPRRFAVSLARSRRATPRRR